MSPQLARGSLVPYWYLVTGLLFVLYGVSAVGWLVWRDPDADWRARSSSALVLVGSILVCIYWLARIYPAWAVRVLSVRFLVLVLAGVAVGTLAATVFAALLVRAIRYVRADRV